MTRSALRDDICKGARAGDIAEDAAHLRLPH